MQGQHPLMADPCIGIGLFQSVRAKQSPMTEENQVLESPTPVDETPGDDADAPETKKRKKSERKIPTRGKRYSVDPEGNDVLLFVQQADGVLKFVPEAGRMKTKAEMEKWLKVHSEALNGMSVAIMQVKAKGTVGVEIEKRISFTANPRFLVNEQEEPEE